MDTDAFDLPTDLMKPTSPLLTVCLGLLLLVSPAMVSANGLIIVDDPVNINITIEPRHPHPVPPPRPPFPPIPPRPRPIHRHMPLDLEEQQVQITVKDQLVTTEVRQVFKNPTSNRLEGTFLFPVPENAQVQEFEMEVNGELVKAELLDAQKARKIYEDIVRRALDPALFEYAGRGLFKVRIFPIEPHAEKEVRIRYTELASKDGDVVRYAYPLNTTKYCLKPIKDFSLKIDVEASKGKMLKTVYSPSHELEITRKGKRKAVLGLETDSMAVDQDLVLYYSLKPEGDEPVALDFLTYHEDGADEPGHFMMLLTPTIWDDNTEVLPKDVVVVFDSSGSMRGPKMDQAKAALKFCINNLNAEDRFEVVRFSTEAEAVFEEMVDATPENRKKALKFVENVDAIGGTAIQEALSLAVSTASATAKVGRPVQVIFMTDGKPTLGATREEVILKSLEKAIGEKKKDIRVFCFGIGTDINTHLLDMVTENTRAVSQYVLPEEDIEEKVSRFYAKISDPVLTDLSVKIEGAEFIRNRYPKDLPDLFRGDQLLVLGRYGAEKLQGKVLVTGWMKGEEQRFEFEVNLGEEKTRNAFIGHLWATRRVGYLLDQVRLQGESEELREEVATLARKYGIVTPYTSYLIMEDEAVRNVPADLRTQSTVPGNRGMVGHGGASAPAVLEEEYDSLRKKSEGADAVAGATATGELKNAKDVSSTRKANEVADTARGRVVGVTPTQNVGGKTFYQKEDELWVDAEAQSLKSDAKRRLIKFGSDEYFDLLAANMELTQWFSVGPEVQVVLGDELVEVRR